MVVCATVGFSASRLMRGIIDLSVTFITKIFLAKRNDELCLDNDMNA
jgi:hypothetical protein